MHSVHGQHHTDINIGLMTELKCCQMHACDNAHIPVLEFLRLLQVLIRLDHRCFDVESDICKPFFDVTHNLLFGVGHEGAAKVCEQHRHVLRQVPVR